MIKTRIVEDNRDLVETYSDIHYNLLQVETGVVYGDSVVDLIDHFEGGSPVSRFTYQEVEPDPDVPETDEPIDDSEALAIITGGEPIDS